jgi:hypothetical protein
MGDDVKMSERGPWGGHFETHPSPISYHLSAITYLLSPMCHNFSTMTYQLQRITYQLSFISYHLSAITYQQAPIRCRSHFGSVRTVSFPGSSCAEKLELLLLGC